jgi:lycopene cyclase domain-containing protein
MYNYHMEYLLILTFWFLAAFVLSLNQKIHLYKSRRERLEIVGFFFVVGVIWESFAIMRGHWIFPPEKTLGIKIGVMPLEEYLFILVVPYGILTFYKFFDSKFRRTKK